VLSSEEATALLVDMDVSTVVGLRDRAIVAVMTYTFARVGAAFALIAKGRCSAARFGKTGALTGDPMSSTAVWRMVRRSPQVLPM
jgi:hypothetical protein